MRTTTKIKKQSTLYVRELTTQYKTLNTPRIKTSSPSDVVDFISEKIGSECREHFSILGINNKNEVVLYYNVSIGTNTESIAHPREVFTAAIMGNCNGIIITHNHPSGNPTPSRQDIETTRRLLEAAKLLGIQLVDHIIVAYDSKDFYSMKDNGCL